MKPHAQQPQVTLPFHSAYVPYLAFAVLHLEQLLEDMPVSEDSITLETAVATMRRVTLTNSVTTTNLRVESWPWERVQDMVTATQTTRDTYGQTETTRQALDITLRFLVNLLVELQEQQTGERHLLCI